MASHTSSASGDQEIVLWHVPQSRSFRVLWYLHETGLPHRVEYASFFGKAMRDPAFLARSPAGRVPAIEVDGITLCESGAILEYLSETRAPQMTRPAGHPERAAYLEWLHYAETVGQHLAQLTQQHIVLREDHMRSPTVMKLEAMRLARALAAIPERTAGQDWLLASGFSAADVALGFGVHLAQRFIRIEEVAGLSDYLARLQARPAFQAALAQDGPVEIYLKEFYEVPQ